MPNKFKAWVMAVAFGVVALLGVGCDRGCDEPEPFESGEFLITQLVLGPVELGDEWLLEALPGAKLTIDRESKIVRIRYELDGTTYELRYDLE